MPSFLSVTEEVGGNADEAKTGPTHGPKRLIGHDRIEMLEFERPKLNVRVTKIAKYACETKPSITARMWAYRSVLAMLNVFDFTVSRHRVGPDQFLLDSHFCGTLLAEGTDYTALRPDQWAATHLEAIRLHRQAERRDRYARKSVRRPERRTAATDSS